MVLGGKVESFEPPLFLIYPGATSSKFRTTHRTSSRVKPNSRPILLRVYDPDMIFEDALKLLMVSFDATIKAHMSVGLQLNVQTYEATSLRIGHKRHIEGDVPYYLSILAVWGDALRDAFQSLPDYTFQPSLEGISQAFSIKTQQLSSILLRRIIFLAEIVALQYYCNASI